MNAPFRRYYGIHVETLTKRPPFIYDRACLGNRVGLFYFDGLGDESRATDTSINVKPLALDAGVAPKKVCIQYNPAVAVSDFLSVVTAGFERHGVATDVYKDNMPPECQYTMTYTATRKWDIVPFMSHAELHIFKGGKLVAEAEYTHHGGLALTKFASNEEKMTPVIDELLAGIN